MPWPPTCGCAALTARHPSAKKQPAHIATKGGFYTFRCETRETTCEDSPATFKKRPQAEDAGANLKFIPVDRRVDRSASAMHETIPFQLKTDTCILKQLLNLGRYRFYSGITPESYKPVLPNISNKTANPLRDPSIITTPQHYIATANCGQVAAKATSKPLETGSGKFNTREYVRPRERGGISRWQCSVVHFSGRL